jgi:hypothetical protein
MAYAGIRPDVTITLRTDLMKHADVQILDITQAHHQTVAIVNVCNGPRLGESCMLKKLSQVQLPRDRPVLITGDFNLHRPLNMVFQSMRPGLTDRRHRRLAYRSRLLTTEQARSHNIPSSTSWRTRRRHRPVLRKRYSPSAGHFQGLECRSIRCP